MWKVQDFSAIQILREINLGGSRSSTGAVFAIFAGSELGEFYDFQLSKSAKMNKNPNSESLNVLKW